MAHNDQASEPGSRSLQAEAEQQEKGRLAVLRCDFEDDLASLRQKFLILLHRRDTAGLSDLAKKLNQIAY